MFNFNTQDFDFNSNEINENNHRFSLQLDDYDDEEIYQAPKKVSNYDEQFNFELFLKTNVFIPLNIDPKIEDKSSTDVDNRYDYKEVKDENGNPHYIAYIYSFQRGKNKNTIHQLYIDLNYTTKALYIGTISNYKTSKYFNISLPLIKITESYKNGLVFLGTMYNDEKPLGSVSAEKMLSFINVNYPFSKISGELSFWHTLWNGEGFYLPDQKPNEKEFTNIEKKLVLSHDFIEHLGGFNGDFSDSNMSLFFKMFENFDGFEKIVKLLCSKDVTIFSDFGFEFNKDNYKEELLNYEDLIIDKLHLERKKNQKISEEEAIAKEKVKDLLPEDVCELFESINSKQPNFLSVKALFKERRSSDIYRKFDLPVIEAILKDNGIDIDKIIKQQETTCLDNIYKLTNVLYKHLKNSNFIFNENYIKNFVVQEFEYAYNSIKIPVKDPNTGEEHLEYFYLNQDEIDIIKNILGKLKPMLRWTNYQDIEIDDSPLDNKSDECIILCKELLKQFGSYSHRLTIWEHEGDNSLYNKFIMLQRFIYLLYKQYTIDNKKEIDNPNSPISEKILYDAQYHENSFSTGYRTVSTYSPFNCGDIPMKINTYTSLYKFIYYMAYAIENGYEVVERPFVGEPTNSYSLINNNHLEAEFDMVNLINNEFSINNVPNIKLLNMDSITKMLKTIFRNINKRLE